MKQEDGFKWCNEALRDLSRHKMLSDEMKDEVKEECGWYRRERTCV